VKKHDLNQQIIAITNEITAYVNAQAQQQTARFETALSEFRTLLTAQVPRRPSSDQATSTDTSATGTNSHISNSSYDKHLIAYTSTATVPTRSGVYDRTLRSQIIEKLGSVCGLHYTSRWWKKDDRVCVEVDFHVLRENADDLFAALSSLGATLDPPSR
jgi:hypothetical protein